MVRVDHNTLLRQKEKFARVCLNIDISKPLPGTLRIPIPFRELSIPLIYEGLHEVCAHCGSNAHSLDQCPKVPSLPKIEVVVEQFQSHGIADAPPPPQSLTPLMRHHQVNLLNTRKNGFGLRQKKGEDPLYFLGTKEVIREEFILMNQRRMCQSRLLYLSPMKHLQWTRGKTRLSWLISLLLRRIGNLTNPFWREFLLVTQLTFILLLISLISHYFPTISSHHKHIPCVTGPLPSPQMTNLKGCAAPPFISSGPSHHFFDEDSSP